MIDERRLIDLTQRFVRFPSPQTELMEAEPQVQAFIGECVTPVLASWGATPRRDQMGNLVVELGPADAPRSVLLMTYAMTHPQSAMANPWDGAVVETAEGKAIRGRGVSEQKAALAAAIIAVEAALGRLSGRLVFALSTAGETGRHDAARVILEGLSRAPALGVVAIGTNNRIALGNKGRIDIDVIVHGKATHSSTPWAGVDAIEGARRVLEQLRGVRLPDREHPSLGRATLTPTHIESGPRATHTVQNEVRLTFDRRLLPGEDPEPALAQIEQAARLPEPWRVEVKRGPFMYPCEVAPDSALVRAINDGHRRAGLAQPATFYSHGALDSGYLATRGCAATMWGPGRMEQFHSDEEITLITELVAGAKAYAGFLTSALT
jgi:acetylornithine deacetylase/succinyl-diaminopimelate desuccinylase-like protein